ncbi:DUF2269 domain-containing protein [Pseudalkalibacillus decolorationis]|uniref:DUF2269 domain-containing protein n=1 Tax=Pseudalkalibacillus decolorationis TaxID=163879 RepID=UPI002148147F|nr:DUF2269 domain-containing protein [Pseudalkalibacillus decolorationis]
MDIYLLLHLIGVILFLGNIITAAFWKVNADRSGDIAHISRVSKGVMVADFVFTLPGILFILFSGLMMAHTGGYMDGQWSWLTLSITLFSVTGIIWLAILLPIQKKMISESQQSLNQGSITNGYKEASLYWAVFGIAATLLPIVILYLMIMKPM